MNKIIKNYLRCFINGLPSSWEKWLPWLEYWYNTSFQAAIKSTPLKVVYGRDPPPLLHFEKNSIAVATLEEQLVERDAILDDIKANLLKAQHRKNKYADAQRR